MKSCLLLLARSKQAKASKQRQASKIKHAKANEQKKASKLSFARSAKRIFFILPPRASWQRQNANFISYYLREPPGGAPNTIFNGAILLLTSTFKKHCKNYTHVVKRDVETLFVLGRFRRRDRLPGTSCREILRRFLELARSLNHH